MARITRMNANRIMSERGWLPLLPEAFRAEVLRRSVLQHFAPGQPVFHLGDPPGGIYGLVAGTVSVSLAPSGASPRLILLGVPGHWTGEACFLTRKPRRGELRAVTETTLMHLPLDAIDQMAARDPQVVHHVALILMMSVEFLFRVIHDLQKPEADRRIASVLQRTTWIGEETPIPLTQSELGVMANASRKQVNAALKRFSKAGWVTNAFRSIMIADPGALRRFAEGDEAD
ncbi:Crp/Fnr family transcriptional regulator [Ensifer sp. 4252]|uniref:Crp/Fnr family transcriptional regulator n=1 Tax=Ensifer sp. 4252 TaxID=3373915 RepID=UPI003D24F416